MQFDSRFPNRVNKGIHIVESSRQKSSLLVSSLNKIIVKKCTPIKLRVCKTLIVVLNLFIEILIKNCKWNSKHCKNLEA